jgi:outer membrane protein TolC
MKSTKRLSYLVKVGGFFCLLCVLFSIEVKAQTVSLSDCYKAAENHYPLIKKEDILKQITQENDAKLKKAYLPSVQALAQATYQNEVTSISIPGANINPPKKDQYKVGLSMTQILFDGGEIAVQRDLNKAQGEVSLQQNTIDLYTVKERISNLFFGALLTDENIKILNNTLKELDNRLNSRKKAYKLGVVQEVELFSFEAEILKFKQQISSLIEDKALAIVNLSVLTGIDLGTQTLQIPSQDISPPVILTSERPEYKFFNLQKKSIGEQLKLTNSKLLPKISLFGEANYGRPGYNFFRTDFGEYWIAGARISWNISSLYTRKEEKSIISLQQNQIDIQSEVFTLSQSIDFNNKQGTLKKLDIFLNQDDEIINLKQKIRIASAAKLENGTTTTTDYLADLQGEQLAYLNKALHQMQRLQAIAQIKLINGTQQ